MLTVALVATAAAWILNETVDPIDGTARATAVLRNHGDALVVQCDSAGAERKLIVAVKPAKYVGFPENGLVEYRYNNQKIIVQQHWDRLRDLVGTFEQFQSRSFVDDMTGAASLAIRLYDRDDFPSTMTFDMPANRVALDQVVDACRVPLSAPLGG